MNKDNEKQLLTTGVYEAPKCEVVEMMGGRSSTLWRKFWDKPPRRALQKRFL